MENFINSFNYKPFMWDFIALSIALLVMFCVIYILFKIYYYVLSDKTENDIKTEYTNSFKSKIITEDGEIEETIHYTKPTKIKLNTIKKYRIIIPISIILLIFTIQQYVESKEIHHLNDIKDNYNITINDNLVSFEAKKSSLFINDKQTFIVTKENNNYKLENINKTYETYSLTKSEFLDIFKPKDKPTNSVDIKHEINNI